MRVAVTSVILGLSLGPSVLGAALPVGGQANGLVGSIKDVEVGKDVEVEVITVDALSSDEKRGLPLGGKGGKGGQANGLIGSIDGLEIAKDVEVEVLTVDALSSDSKKRGLPLGLGGKGKKGSKGKKGGQANGLIGSIEDVEILKDVDVEVITVDALSSDEKRGLPLGGKGGKGGQANGLIGSIKNVEILKDVDVDVLTVDALSSDSKKRGLPVGQANGLVGSIKNVEIGKDVDVEVLTVDALSSEQRRRNLPVGQANGLVGSIKNVEIAKDVDVEVLTVDALSSDSKKRGLPVGQANGLVGSIKNVEIGKDVDVEVITVDALSSDSKRDLPTYENNLPYQGENGNGDYDNENGSGIPDYENETNNNGYENESSNGDYDNETNNNEYDNEASNGDYEVDQSYTPPSTTEGENYKRSNKKPVVDIDVLVTIGSAVSELKVVVKAQLNIIKNLISGGDDGLSLTVIAQIKVALLAIIAQIKLSLGAINSCMTGRSLLDINVNLQALLAIGKDALSLIAEIKVVLDVLIGGCNSSNLTELSPLIAEILSLLGPLSVQVSAFVQLTAGNLNGANSGVSALIDICINISGLVGGILSPVSNILNSLFRVCPSCSTQYSY